MRFGRDPEQTPAGVPSALAAILHQLSPKDAARVQAIVQEFRDREAPLQHEIAETEAAVKAAVFATGASAYGAHLQAMIMAPRITWDTKGMAATAPRSPEASCRHTGMDAPYAGGVPDR
jgi:hypothetical protein